MIRVKFKKNQKKRNSFLRNKARIRKKIEGTQQRPRLNVFRSSKHIYAQIIDDISQKTLESCSTLIFKGKVKGKLNQAEKVGEELAKKTLSKKIDKVVFDRGGFLYHGRIKALAEGARKAGLKF